MGYEFVDQTNLFPDEVSWTDAAKALAEDGFEVVDDELSYLGVPFVNIDNTSPTYDVFARNTALNGPLGGVVCTGSNPYIWLNINLLPARSVAFSFAARHELLHAANLAHAGNNDSRDGTFPSTMSTCNSATQIDGYNSVGELPLDDAAALNWQHNLFPKSQLTANVGFERGETYWKEQNMAATAVSSGGNGGPTYMSMFALGSQTTSYIHQTVRVWHDRTKAPGRYKSKLNVKETNASNTTLVRTQVLLKRMIDPGPANSCTTGQYQLGLLNPNAETVSGGWVVVSVSPMTNVQASGWVVLNSPLVKPKDAPDGQHLNGAHGYELQYRVYGKATTTGGAVTSFQVDNARAERA